MNILVSKEYEELLKEVKHKFNINILDNYSENAVKRMKQNMLLAKFSSEQAIELLNNEKESFLKYVSLKIEKFENVKQKQEYSKGEESDEFEDNRETILGYSKVFLLMYLIEFFILKEKPDDLLLYLKKNKIPYANKYEKDLKVLYNKIWGTFYMIFDQIP